MSTRTSERNLNLIQSEALSMSNQWARSHRLQCQQVQKHDTINATPIGMILATMSTRT